MCRTARTHAGLDRRPGADGDRCDSASGGIRRSRQSARAGGDDEGATWPRCPTCRRSSQFVTGYEAIGWSHRRPEEHAKRYYREAQCRRERRARSADAEGAACRSGRRAGEETPAEFAQFISAENDKWSKVIRAANLELDRGRSGDIALQRTTQPKEFAVAVPSLSRSPCHSGAARLFACRRDQGAGRTVYLAGRSA